MNYDILIQLTIQKERFYHAVFYKNLDYLILLKGLVTISVLISVVNQNLHDARESAKIKLLLK